MTNAINELNDSAPGVEITILLPAYNEEEAIVPVMKQVREVMDGLGRPYEILVVDDCSTDRTAQLAEDAGARMIRHTINSGSGASRRTGVRAAKGEIIIMLDADGTYEPRTIPEMLEYFPQYDQVNGARTSEQGTHKFFRVPAKWFIRKFAIYLSGTPIPDLNTGLKAFKRSVMLRYLWLMPDGFSCVTTMTLAFLTNGHPVKYVSTPYYTRIGVSKFHPVKDTAKYMTTVLRMCAYFRPLRVFGPLSILLFVIGCILMTLALWNKGPSEYSAPGIVALCTSLIVAAIGVILDIMIAQRVQSFDRE